MAAKKAMSRLGATSEWKGLVFQAKDNMKINYLFFISYLKLIGPRPWFLYLPLHFRIILI